VGIRITGEFLSENMFRHAVCLVAGGLGCVLEFVMEVDDQQNLWPRYGCFVELDSESGTNSPFFTVIQPLTIPP